MANVSIVSLGLCLGALLQLEMWNLALLTVMAAVRTSWTFACALPLTHLGCKGSGYYGAHLSSSQRLSDAQ